MLVRFEIYNPDGEVESVVYDHHDLAITSGFLLRDSTRVVQQQINAIGRFLRAHRVVIEREVRELDETPGSDSPNKSSFGRSYSDSALGEDVRPRAILSSASTD